MQTLRSKIQQITASLVFVAVLVAVFFPALTAPPGYMLFGDDFFRSYVYFRDFLRQEILSGTIPLWNPYLFSGTPMLANPSVAYLYPPNILSVILDPRIAHPILTVFHVALAMGGMHLFLTRIMHPRMPMVSGLVSAVSFGLSGYMMARIWAGHSEIIAAIAWIPWVVGAFFRLNESFTTRRLVAAAAFLSMMIYAGYQTIALFALEIVGVLVLMRVIVTRSLRPALHAFAAVTLGIGLSALQLIPSYEYFRESIRTYAFPYEWASRGSIEFASLGQFAYPFMMGNQYTFTGPPPNYHEQAAYTGIVALIAAIAGLAYIVIGKRRHVRIAVWLVIVATASVWIALGPNAPVNIHRFFWETVPLYGNLRFPARHLVQVSFAIAVLAGMGVGMVRQTFLRIAILAAVIIDMTLFARHFVEIRESPGQLHDRELVRTVKGVDREDGDGLFRLLPNFGVWTSPRDSLDFDSVMPYRIFSASGYDPSILRDYYDFADASIGTPQTGTITHDVQIPYLDVFSPAIDFLNIRYVLLPPAYDPISWFPDTDEYRLVAEDMDRGYRLYENLSVLPRFFLVPEAREATRESQLSFIRERGIRFSDEVLIETEPFNANPCESGLSLPVVDVQTYGTNEIRLQVASPCDAYLSTSEVMYPGWEATIDGKPTPILRVNWAFRGLSIPQGAHTIVFRYVPRIFFFGAFVSVSSFALAILLMRKRRS